MYGETLSKWEEVKILVDGIQLNDKEDRFSQVGD
jgi:hypothetical protein